MVRVEITLCPSDGSAPRLLGRGKIVNTGEGTSTDGIYRVELEKSPEYAKPGDVGKPWKMARIRGFKRLKLGPWDLLFRALLATVGDRNVEDVLDALEPYAAKRAAYQKTKDKA